MSWLVLSFPAGQLHATPWGRHVNEGAIEFPPSPWRLLRGLMATGYSKLGWFRLPPEAERLFDKLASVLPDYRIARELATAHTRHYMPDFRDGRDRVIDAFAVVPRDLPALAVRWPVVLDDGEATLFESLVARMSYLGRAEAWADGAIATEAPGHLVPCVAGDAPPGPGHEDVRLLAPMEAGALASWIEKVGLGLAPRVRARVPTSVCEALAAQTTALQKDGWSQPPGSRWVTYWRPADTLVARPEPVAVSSLVRRAQPTTALLAVSSDTSQAERFPSMTNALWRGEAIHKTLVKRATEAPGASGRAPGCLTGKDAIGRPMEGHRHAFVLPLDLRAGGRRDNDARMDHVLVHAPGGLDEAALWAVSRVRRTYAKNMPEMFLTLVGTGKLEDFAARVPGCGAHRMWRSTTPFVPPRHLKSRGKDTLLGQIESECQARGLPNPTSIEVELEGGGYASAAVFAELFAPLRSQRAEAVDLDDRLATRWRHFKRERQKSDRQPPQSLAVGLRLSFGVTVSGPIALGYASHLGLGTFEPLDHEAWSGE